VSTAIDYHSHADYHFYKLGLHYYATARFAFFSAMLPLTGNLYHHGVEMVLKGRLTHGYSLQGLRQFSHDLMRCWAAFKALYPAENLSPFDDLVAALHTFERLRYPDHLLAHGAHISFTLKSNPPPLNPPMPNQPGYQLSFPDLDVFMDRLFTLCQLRVSVIAQGMTERGKQMLTEQNAFASAWFPPSSTR
jgi:hypothetical protein